MNQDAELYAQLLEKGDYYLSCEKAFQHVRKLKHEGRLNDAMIFLMELAHLLIDRQAWEPAVTCAKRSIDLFPRDSKTILRSLKLLFVSFAEKATKETAVNDFFAFCTRLSSIFPDLEELLLMKQATICGQASYHYQALIFYLRKLSDFPNEEQDQSIVELIHELIRKWVSSLSEENKKQSQFIWAKAALAMACISETGLAYGDYLISDVFDDLPLLNFTRFFLRALRDKSEPTAKFLLEKYDKWLQLDDDVVSFARHAKRERIPQQQANPFAGLGQIFQNLFGSLGQ